MTVTDRRRDALNLPPFGPMLSKSAVHSIDQTESLRFFACPFPTSPFFA
jgi:hypothetical protein